MYQKVGMAIGQICIDPKRYAARSLSHLD